MTGIVHRLFDVTELAVMEELAARNW